MDRAKKTLRGTRDLSLGEAAGFAATFVRYLVLARVLGPEQFGIAASLALTVQILQTISNMALNMLIVQSKRGERNELLATAHSVQILRGLVSAGIIAALAWPVSAMFGVPEARWAFQVLALAPMLEGLLHLDVFRMEREMRFRPGICVNVLPKIASAAAAWPVAVWLGDYSAALWLLIGQGAVAVIASHALAERPYRPAWDGASAAEIFRFGWPLLLNGVLFFAISQGDRFIVGAAYGMRDLGIYAAAAGMVMTLSGSLFKIVQTVALPALSRAQDSPREFMRRHRICLRWFAVLSAVYGPALILAGGPVAILVYGAGYRAAGVLVAWLAAAQAIRLLRLAPSLSAMARGDTQCLMHANLLRLTGVGAAAIAALVQAELVWVAASAVLGELAAVGYPVWRLSRRHGVPASTGAWPFALSLACVAAAGAAVATGRGDVLLAVGLAALGVAAAAVCVWAVLSFSSLRRRAAPVGDALEPREEGDRP